MPKHVVNNEKNRLIADIKKTWASALSDAKSSMDKAIYTGELLTKLKEKTPHGQWEKVLNDNFELSFGRVQASILMRCFANKELIKIATDGEVLTIHEMIKTIQSATQEQIAEAEDLKAKQAEADKQEAYRKELLKKDAEAKKAKAAQDKKDGIIDGEFSEVKPATTSEPAKINIEPEAPKAEPEKSIDDLFHEEIVSIIDDQEQIHADLRSENARLEKIISADDNVAFLLSENARLTRELADMTNSSNRHMANVAKLQGENNGLRDQLKRLRKESKVIVK